VKSAGGVGVSAATSRRPRCASRSRCSQLSPLVWGSPLLRERPPPRHVRANTNQSSNWFGYNQGTLEQGGTLFNSITGDWTVPTASRHTASQDEYSSDWIGIGGGCVDAGCSVGDNTLIQTGTEQDVSAAGQASYSAWWEIIPGPSIAISMTVQPGDHMHASVAETVPNSNVWVITLQDVTQNETFTQTVPYSSPTRRPSGSRRRRCCSARTPASPRCPT
jgi:peptidase A4-like protein